MFKDCRSSSEGGTKGTCGFLQGKKEAQQELGFKEQKMLTSHLLKDKGHPWVPVGMSTYVSDIGNNIARKPALFLSTFQAGILHQSPHKAATVRSRNRLLPLAAATGIINSHL